MSDPGSQRNFNRPAGFQVPVILAVLLLAVSAVPSHLPDNFALYLPLHIIFEIASSGVAFLIFVVGWLSFQRSAPASVLLIAVTFLGVSLLDIGHLLSYDGMPALVTPSGPEKAIQFWLAARLLAAIGLALAIIVPWQHLEARASIRGLLLAGVLSLVAVIFAVILFAPERLPATFNPATGLTPFKVITEYTVVVIHLATVGLLWINRRSIPHIDTRALAIGILVIVLSELLFTLYESVTDTFNLLGHIYKIIAYYYLFYAIVVSGIEQPWRKLNSAQARLKATLQALPDIVFELDRDGVVYQFHSRYPHLLAQPESVEGRCLFDLLPDAATQEVQRLLADIDEHGRSGSHHYRLEVNGEFRDYEAAGNLLQDPDTSGKRYIVIVQDITQRKQLDHELRIAAAAFESQESICVTDADHRTLRVNSAFTRITGFDEQEVVGRPPATLLSDEDREDFDRRIAPRLSHDNRWRGEVHLRHKQGDLHCHLLMITAVRGEDNELRNFVYDYVDINALRKAETRIQRLALYDALTGLGNRRSLELCLSRVIEENRAFHQFSGLLLINLMRFRKVSDAMGINAGDQLLIEVAQELRGISGHHVTAFRRGADEFVLVIERAGETVDEAAGTTQQFADRVFASLNRIFIIDGKEYSNRCQIGATVFDDRIAAGSEAVNQAAIAMHEMTSTPGQTFSFFDPEMQARVSREQTLESELGKAVPENQFVLHYQPKIDANHRVIGFEALIRWNHPVRGLLLPGEFIPTAEKTGLIVPIEKWTLEQAIAQLARWQAQPATSGWSISVNVASSQFYRDEFETHLDSLLRDYRINTDRLILEFTESTLLNDVHAAQAKIQRLADRGIRFSIDDFGTGYSSLAYLGRLSVHELKIDRSFVRDLDKADYNAAIVRMIIEMAHILGMQVVAEGVETRDQCEFLVDGSCDLLQGFLFGEAMPIEELQREYAPGSRAAREGVTSHH